MQVEKVDSKEIEKIIEKNYRCKIDLSVYSVFRNKDGKIFISAKGIPKKLVDASSYIGLYLGKIKRNEKIQLSIEGSQIVGPKAKKNIATLNDKNIKKWMEGMTIEEFDCNNCEERNFVLITNGEDFFGSGLFKENKIENYVPKGRRIMINIKKV